MATDPRKALKHYVAQFARQKDAARSLGISQQFLSQMLLRRADISDRILRKLGIKRVESFESIAE